MSFTTPSLPAGLFFQLSDLGLPVSQAQFMQIWLTAMQAAIPSYSPSTSDPLYIDAQIKASWAAACAQQCNAGATEIFRQFGPKLLGIPFNQGSSALAVVTVTAIDSLGHTLPTGTQLTLTLNGTQVAFQTTSTLTIPASSSSGNVTVASIQTGSGFNGAGSPAALEGVSWVASVTVVTNSSGGVDLQDDDSYVVQLAADTATLRRSVVNASDAARFALDFQPAAGTDQEEVGRATAIDGYSPGPQTFVVSTSSTAAITVTTPPAAGVVAAPYATVTGTNIPAGAYVLPSPAPTTSGFSISANATGTGTGISATVNGSYSNERTIAVCISDTSGLALNSDTETAVATSLQAQRETGFIFNVFAPNYTTLYVKCTVGGIPGFDSATVQANVQAAILGYLNPPNFALPQGALVGWNNQQTVYISQVETAIQLAQGVAYVQSGSLKVDIVSTPTNTSDLLIAGAFPLPVTTTATVPTSNITVL